MEETETTVKVKENKNKTVVNASSGCGALWAIGWLFTIGFAKLTFWQGVLAIIIWPYHLGNLLSVVK